MNTSNSKDNTKFLNELLDETITNMSRAIGKNRPDIEALVYDGLESWSQYQGVSLAEFNMRERYNTIATKYAEFAENDALGTTERRMYATLSKGYRNKAALFTEN